jgi:hypothetical protein
VKHNPEVPQLVEELRVELRDGVQHPGKFTDVASWRSAVTKRSQWLIGSAY